MSELLAERMNSAALRLNVLVGESLGTMPLMANFYPAGPATSGGWLELVEVFSTIRDELGSPRTQDDTLLDGMLRAFELQARVGAGEVVSWVDQVKGFVQVNPDLITTQVISSLRDDLGQALDQAGYSDELPKAVSTWLHNQTIPKESFDSEAQRYLHESRRLTERINPLPAETNIQLNVVHDVFYNGYNEYFGNYRGECRLNGDFRWAYPQLRHTVAHEAFPGHHAISAIKEAQAQQRTLPKAAALYYARTPLTPIIEGVCEFANSFLDWQWDVHDHVYSRLNRYRKAILTNAAIAVNRDSMPRDEAIQLLKTEAMADQDWAEARYTFLTHPLWNTSFPHYWFGTEVIRTAIEQLEHAELSQHIFNLTHHYPHSVETFQNAVQVLLAQKDQEQQGSESE